MTQKKPLRVGLLIDSFNQSQWVLKIVADIQASSVADVVLLIKNTAEDSRPAWPRRLVSDRKYLLYKTYRKLDHALFARAPDAFALSDIRPLIAASPVLDVTPRQTTYSDYFPDEVVASIELYHLDVALRFGFRILRGKVLACAQYGVWSYHHGDNLGKQFGEAGLRRARRDFSISAHRQRLLALYRSVLGY